MWAADVGLVVGGILVGLWVIAASVLMTGRGRTHGRLARRGLLVPVMTASGSAVALLALYVAVVGAVEDTSALSVVDGPVHSWFLTHRTGSLSMPMEDVSAVGGTAGMAVLATIAAALLLWSWRWPHALIVLVAMVGGDVLGDVFKGLYARARPPVADQLVVTTSYSLPSGHSLESTVVLGVLAAVGVLLVSGRARRTGIVGVAVAVVLLIGASRLYLGVHWPTDVLSGYLLGGAWVAVCVGSLVVFERTRADARGRACLDTDDLASDSPVPNAGDDHGWRDQDEADGPVPGLRPA
jgi:membrane-associated phospholipid phosphatase